VILILILGAIVSVGTALSVRAGLYYYGERNRSFDWEGFGGGMFGTLMAFVIVPLFFLLIVTSTTTGVHQTRYELEALGNQSETSGTFFLGSGVIDEEQVFQYLRKAEDGGVTLHTIDADRVVVYEDSVSGAHMLKNDPYFYDPLWIPWEISSRQSSTISFHVPDGSINSEYRISVTD
jgi:uncharacterized membrane protein